MGMRILRTMLKQTCVYWGTPRSDGRGGVTTVQPVEVKCRWEDKIEEFMTPAGKREVSKSVINVASLDGGVREGEDMEVGGFLLQVSLASLGNNLDLKLNRKAEEIRLYAKLPTLKGDEFLRTVWL